MRIVLAMISIDLAGGVREVFEVANGLKSGGHDVWILSLLGDSQMAQGAKRQGYL